MLSRMLANSLTLGKVNFMTLTSELGRISRCPDFITETIAVTAKFFRNDK